MEINTIIHGDCLEKMKELDSNSVDTIITDPPYGLSFMGKKWDYDVPGIEVWQECLRVLKPGGTALIFAGSRTQHRMACNVEDAGFELFDVIQYLYGSGFPKSHNIGKSTKDEKWNGWGTQLKPAYEPILCCRKKTEGTYANNAIKWGVSGLNIDGSRIGYKDDADKKEAEYNHKGNERFKGEKQIFGSKLNKDLKVNFKEQGRFPANIILDEEAAKILDEHSGKLKSGGATYNKGTANCWLGGNKKTIVSTVKGDKGGASRFFYCAKASKAERNAGCEELFMLKEKVPEEDLKEIKHLLSI